MVLLSYQEKETDHYPPKKKKKKCSEAAVLTERWRHAPSPLSRAHGSTLPGVAPVCLESLQALGLCPVTTAAYQLLMIPLMILRGVRLSVQVGT